MSQTGPDSSTGSAFFSTPMGILLFAFVVALLDTPPRPADILPAVVPGITSPSAPLLDAPKPSPVDTVLSGYYNGKPKAKSERPPIDCLIALVPDPVESHFQLMFDNSLSSLIRAFGAQRFTIDRFHLNWKAQTGPDTVKEPSAILFRRPSLLPQNGEDMNDLVLLMLVGETPTAGVNRPALHAALKHAKTHAPTGQPCRILGPLFSGAASSLRRELAAWAATAKQPSMSFDVISGSATADQNAAILNVENDASAPGLTCSFRTTILPDSLTLKAALHHLTMDRRIPLNKIALLTENTTYGSQIDQTDRGIRRLAFPLSLSRMRSESAKSRPARAEETNASSRRYGGRRNLDLSPESARNANDVLPTFSDATPATADLALEHVLSTILRDDIRAVGIAASDIQDTLFLSREIRMHAPDVLMFVLESDILLTHSDYSPHIEGTIVASTYPLFTRNRRWTHQDPTSLQFPTTVAQGIYNAALVHLGELRNEFAPVLDYAFPFAPTPADQVAQPPVWLTVAADTGLWPVAIYPADEKSGSIAGLWHPSETFPKSNQPALPLNVEPPSLIPLFATSCLVLATSILFWIVNWPSTRAATCFARWTGWIRQRCDLLSMCDTVTENRRTPRDFDIQRWTLITLLLCGMQIVLMIVATPVWNYLCFFGHPAGEFFPRNLLCESLWKSPWSGIWYHHPLQALVTVAFSAAAWVAVYAVILPPPVCRFRRACWLLGFAPLAVFMIWVVSRRYTSWTDLAIRVERLGAYGSGVTPVIPLVLSIGATLLFLIFQLRRGHWLRMYGLDSPFRTSLVALTPATTLESTALDTFQGGLPEQWDSLDSALSKTVCTPPTLIDWIFLSIIAGSFGYVFYRWIGTAEGFTVDLAFGIVTAVAVFCICVLMLQFRSVTRLLEQLLRTLGQLPLANAFPRVPQRLRDKASGNILASAPHPGDLVLPVRALNQLAETYRIEPTIPRQGTMSRQQFGDAVRDCERQFAELMRLPRESWQATSKAAMALQADMARVLRDFLIPHLVPYWNQQPIESSAAERGTTGPQDWHQQAETLLAMYVTFSIRHIFTHLQSMMTTLVLMLLILFCGFSSYPFLPSQLLQLHGFLVMSWIAVAFLVAMVTFNRNEILSLISDSTPNKFTLDRTMILTVLTYIVIPAAGLLAAQFPSVGRTVLGWMTGVQHFVSH